MSVYEKGLITVLAVNALFILISIPLALNKIPRNVAYGYRTRATLADDRIWYPVNALFAKWLIGTSLASCAVIAGLYAARIGTAIFFPLSVVVMIAPAVVAIFPATRLSGSMSRELGPTK